MSLIGLSIPAMVTALTLDVARLRAAPDAPQPVHAPASANESSRSEIPALEGAAPIEAAVQRLRSGSDAELHEYRARRWLHAVNRRFEAEAWVAGPSEFDMVYEYERINGEEVRSLSASVSATRADVAPPPGR